jgi:hypothetical protein
VSPHFIDFSLRDLGQYNAKGRGQFGLLVNFCVQGASLMAGNSSTFGKRQKERARQEKQAEKAQRKAQRKLQQEAKSPDRPKDLTITYDEEGRPEGFGFHDF